MEGILSIELLKRKMGESGKHRMGLEGRETFQRHFLTRSWWSPSYLHPKHGPDGHSPVLIFGWDF